MLGRMPDPVFPPATPPRAAIIDLDGTLVDTLDDFTAALARMLATLGYPALPRARVATLVGKGSEHLVRSVLQQVGAPQERYEAAWAAYQQAYRAVNGQYATVFPGVAEGLARLQALGLRLACLTNKPTEFARTLLAAKGLDTAFGLVFGGDAFARRKPDPLPVLETCAALGVAPAEALVVGDSSNDARAARAAGCPVVLLTYGYNHGEPVRAVDADGWFDSLDAVAQALQRRG